MKLRLHQENALELNLKKFGIAPSRCFAGLIQTCTSGSVVWSFDLGGRLSVQFLAQVASPVVLG